MYSARSPCLRRIVLDPVSDKPVDGNKHSFKKKEIYSMIAVVSVKIISIFYVKYRHVDKLQHTNNKIAIHNGINHAFYTEKNLVPT